MESAIPEDVRVQLQMNGPTEMMMEDAFVRLLARRGRAPRRQVKCGVGKADVVDCEFCYELKRHGGNPAEFFQAVGQAVCYAASLGLRPAVVLMHAPRREDYIDAAERAGIVVLFLSSDEVVRELY